MTGKKMQNHGYLKQHASPCCKSSSIVVKGKWSVSKLAFRLIRFLMFNIFDFFKFLLI
jgi:hypothetical protein